MFTNQKVLPALSYVLFFVFVSAAGCQTDGSDRSFYSTDDEPVADAYYYAKNSSCKVEYNKTDDWGHGFVGRVQLINAGNTPIDGWEVTWTFGGNQSIDKSWSGGFNQSGRTVRVTPLSWNTLIEPGRSAEFGFSATYSGENKAPSDFRVNGQRCGEAPSDPGGDDGNTEDVDTHPSTDSDADSDSDSDADDDVFTGPEDTRESMATHFFPLGKPTGGCGVPEDILESKNYVALNVQYTPGDYASHFDRPIGGEHAGAWGEFQNGANCGRWVRVKIGDYCTGVNSGVAGSAWCENGNWTKDEFTGATLDMIVTDSCQDGNRWCRDDRFHLDLSTPSLERFRKNGSVVPNLKDKWNNRRISWQYIQASNYSGDIKIGFVQNAQKYWPTILITNLKNGIHGVDNFVNGSWEPAKMVGDNGQVWELKYNEQMNYQIRVYDADDRLLHNGRTYRFGFPASCGSTCSAVYTEVGYSI